MRRTAVGDTVIVPTRVEVTNRRRSIYHFTPWTGSAHERYHRSTVPGLILEVDVKEGAQVGFVLPVPVHTGKVMTASSLYVTPY